jgi:hypothetical protein
MIKEPSATQGFFVLQISSDAFFKKLFNMNLFKKTFPFLFLNIDWAFSNHAATNFK